GRGSHGRGPGHGRGKALHPGAARAAARPRRRGDPHAHGHAARDARRGRGEAASPGMIPDRLVVATANRGKLGELRELVAEWGSVAIAGVDEFPAVVLPAEVGTTYAENARAKATAVMRATGLPALGPGGRRTPSHRAGAIRALGEGLDTIEGARTLRRDTTPC